MIYIYILPRCKRLLSIKKNQVPLSANASFGEEIALKSTLNASLLLICTGTADKNPF